MMPESDIRNHSLGEEENPFSLSLGDLMAAILLIFVLLLSATLLMLREEYNKKNQLAEETRLAAEETRRRAEEIQKIAQMYNRLKVELFDDLFREFRSDLEKWNAVLDRETLSVRFQEPDVLFGRGEAGIKPSFQAILDDFFPRYIRILAISKYKENIEEIRIEGHTSSEWINETDPTRSYFKNMELSQDRTRSVLEYVLRLVRGEQREWSQRLITANGLSSSKLIQTANGEEDQDRSRRVEFRVRTNADVQIGRMLEQTGILNYGSSR